MVDRSQKRQMALVEKGKAGDIKAIYELILINKPLINRAIDGVIENLSGKEEIKKDIFGDIIVNIIENFKDFDLINSFNVQH